MRAPLLLLLSLLPLLLAADAAPGRVVVEPPRVGSPVDYEPLPRLEPPEVTADSLPRVARKAFSKLSRSYAEERDPWLEKLRAALEVSRGDLEGPARLLLARVLEEQADRELDVQLDAFAGDPCHARGDCGPAPQGDYRAADAAFAEVAGGRDRVAAAWANYLVGRSLYDIDPARAVPLLARVTGSPHSPPELQAQALRMQADEELDAARARMLYGQIPALGIAGGVTAYARLMSSWLAHEEGDFATALTAATGIACAPSWSPEYRRAARGLALRVLSDRDDWQGEELLSATPPACAAELLQALGEWALDAGHVDFAGMAFHAALERVPDAREAPHRSELLDHAREVWLQRTEQPHHWLRRVARLCYGRAHHGQVDATYELPVRARFEGDRARLVFDPWPEPNAVQQRLAACLSGPLPRPRATLKDFDAVLEFASAGR